MPFSPALFVGKRDRVFFDNPEVPNKSIAVAPQRPNRNLQGCYGFLSRNGKTMTESAPA